MAGPILRPRAASRALARWYGRNARELPWRGSASPWGVLVSEVILQQTTVETAIPYYGRIMVRFPDPPALAAARDEDLLKLWSGLGYYSRARNLRRAAIEIVRRHGGEVPPAREDLLALPGVGSYTAAAVAAIAFHRPGVALDGNLRRVLSRLCGYRGDPAVAAGSRHLDAAGRALIDGQDPAVVNQALMDLGASLCAPRAPDCPACPLRSHCVARREGSTAEIPAARRRPPAVAVRMAALVVRREGKILLRRREGRLMKGLWEFPLVELERSPAPSRGGAAARRPGRSPRGAAPPRRGGGEEGAAFPGLLAATGIRASRPVRSGEIRHSITNHRIRVEVYTAKAARGGAPRRGRAREAAGSGATAGGLAGPEGGRWAWVAERTAPGRPLTGIARKILGVLSTGARSGRAITPGG